MVFFFNDTATTEIYTLSLHDALPIWFRGGAARRRHRSGAVDRPAPARRAAACARPRAERAAGDPGRRAAGLREQSRDRKSTRLNSSHMSISYAVFCLKKKKKNQNQ